MTTYHLEHRVPRSGERYIDRDLLAPDMRHTPVLEDNSDVKATIPQYVITEDRPKSDHPEALLIRVNGELYGRTYVSSSNEAVYTSVNVCTNFQYASDITEWEDVYDEVTAPEPTRPTADVIRITALDPGHRHASDVPTIAIRQDQFDATDIWYRTRSGFLIDAERITAWDDIDTGDGDTK